MAYIPSGVPSIDKVPSMIVNVAFAQGQGSSANQDRDILLIGLPTAAIADGYGPYLIQSESEAIGTFGARSQVTRMFRRIIQTNNQARVYGLATTEASAGVKATNTIVLSGTASGSGDIVATVNGEQVSVGFGTGDLAAAIATKLANAINAISYLPFTAAAVTGTITLTAVHKGIEGNEFTYRAKATTGKGITVVNTGTKLASGSGVANVAASLSNILATQYYYQVLAQTDATSVQLLTAQIESLAAPNSQVEQVGLFGSVADVTTAKAITTAATVNSARMQCVQLLNSEVPSCELAALVAGIRSREEQNDFGKNLNGQSLPIVAPYTKSDWASKNVLRDALENGVTALACDKYGNVSIPSSRTTFSKNKLVLTENDYRCSKTYVVSVSDAFANDVRSDINSQMRGKKVSDDTKEPAKSNVVQPKHLRALVIKWLKEYSREGQFDLAMLPTMISSLDCVKSTGTLSAQLNIFTTQDLEHVYAIALESSDPQ